MTNITEAQLAEAQKTLDDRLMGIIDNLAKKVTALERVNGELGAKVREQEEAINK